MMKEEELAATREAIEEEIAEAVEFASSSPLTPVEVLYEDVYGSYSNSVKGLR